MEAGSCPFGILFVNLFEEFEIEGIFLFATIAGEGEGVWGELDGFISDVHKLNFKEDFIFPLSPFYNWMAKWKQKYSMASWIFKIL